MIEDFKPGDHVIYNNGDGVREEGVVSSVGDNCVFVCYCTPNATNPQVIEMKYNKEDHRIFQNNDTCYKCKKLEENKVIYSIYTYNYNPETDINKFKVNNGFFFDEAKAVELIERAGEIDLFEHHTNYAVIVREYEGDYSELMSDVVGVWAAHQNYSEDEVVSDHPFLGPGPLKAMRLEEKEWPRFFKNLIWYKGDG